MGNILEPFNTAIAQVILFWHRATGAAFGEDTGLAWALAIVLLTVTIRLVLFPLFVKQIKTQRAMTELQPKIKALQAKHKGDRETLNTELMKLYKEHGTNPAMGCLPLLLQMPLLFALFNVLRALGPNKETGIFPSKFGVSQDLAQSLGEAKIFGAPLAAGWNSSKATLGHLEASSGTVRVVALLLIAFMTITTFITTKQMMAKSAATMDKQQQTQQKVMLYLIPGMLVIFGFSVPIGVLVYWCTTNVWSMAQQHFVLKKMPHVAPGGGSAAGGSAAKPSGPPPPTSPSTPNGATARGGAKTSVAAGSQRSGNRSKKRGKGQRRGGRR